MTNENYISYLVGTANGYPSKTQRYLKMLFSTAGIAVPDDQISIPFDVDTTVNIKDKELSEQIAMCLEQSASARRIFEKWDLRKIINTQCFSLLQILMIYSQKQSR